MAAPNRQERRPLQCRFSRKQAMSSCCQCRVEPCQGRPAKSSPRYLHRNGVLCEPITVQPEGRSTGEAILAHAASLQCDLLIKGAYTQSRLRQMIFGGATRHILA